MVFLGAGKFRLCFFWVYLVYYVWFEVFCCLVEYGVIVLFSLFGCCAGFTVGFKGWGELGCIGFKRVINWVVFSFFEGGGF